VSRRKRDLTRSILPDAKYGSIDMARFINKLMRDGKKQLAERIFYNAVQQLAEKTTKDPLESFDEALNNIVPVMEVKSRRVGGSTYQVPVSVAPKRGKALAMRWIIAASDAKNGDMQTSLANELFDAFNKVGVSYKKREDVHKMAESNKAFSHFGW
jgi:small subunit ribosomal protein S7